MPNFIDLTGQTFGRLTVIAKGEKNKWGNYKWLCRCDCGVEKPIESNNLKRGLVVSCGCFRNERIRQTCGKPDRDLPEYTTWLSMRQRCRDVNCPCYTDYGGRGITVCDRWVNSYENFLADMGRRPTADHQIDRVDNEKGYSPENCRWVTRKANCRNRRDNAHYEYKGETLTLSGWAERTGLKVGTLGMRIRKYGWSLERAFTTPVR